MSGDIIRLPQAGHKSNIIRGGSGTIYHITSDDVRPIIHQLISFVILNTVVIYKIIMIDKIQGVQQVCDTVITEC